MEMLIVKVNGVFRGARKYEPDTFYSFRVINEKRSSFQSGQPGGK